MLFQALRRSSSSVITSSSSKRMKFNQIALLAATTLFSSSPHSQTRAFSIRPSPNKTTMESLDNIDFQNSWIKQLSPETPENLKKSRNAEGLRDNDTNQTKRQVFNGHYVMVKPSGLRNPRLMLVSQDVAENILQFTEDQIQSHDFLQFVSGNLVLTDSWATPYALSIMGTRYTNNCPYGTGNGYGDGRAVSIGEFHNHELQLKGGGTTPFHRGADGRAVLRSSIREFLASEAMHHLGIRTTRALSLIVSENGDTSQRAWYAEGSKLALPSPDDPRLANYTAEEKRALLMQLRNEKVDPNVMIREPNAITCRVAPSFVRVGHLDLFARRVEKIAAVGRTMFADKSKPKYDQTTREYKELEDLVWHACYREFRDDAYTPFHDKQDVASAATVLLEQSADRLSDMVAGWIRVGFAQGNFNADNCLVGGHTMDYGPFGFMEEYNPLFAKWTGSGKHFGFMNQPNAAFVNYQVLVESVVPIICAATGDDDTEAMTKKFMLQAQPLFEVKVEQAFRNKLGFSDEMEIADDLWQQLQLLFRATRVDWTLFWRQLTMVAAEYDDYEDDDNFEAMLEVLIADGDQSPFYEPLTDEFRAKYLDFIKQWRSHLVGQDDVAERMRMANPKYVLREWMLVNAYNEADKGEECELHDLFALIQSPYDEGTPDQAAKYYRRTPIEFHLAGGAAFMS